MINFITRPVPTEGGTISRYMDNLPLIASNAALDKMASIYQERCSDLECEDHPKHIGNNVYLTIVGGNVMDTNSMSLDFEDFCCDKFCQKVRDHIIK